MSTPPAVDISGDHHVHTRLCNHAAGEMEEYVQAALHKGLKKITFLEHLECGIVYAHRTWLTPDHFKDYFLQGRLLQQRYAGRIIIRLGVELGYNPHAVDELTSMLQQFPYEHIGLSYHFFFDGTRHLNMVSRRKKNLALLAEFGAAKILDGYFSGLLQAVGQLPCDKICHLDAALRHLPGVRFNDRNYELIEQLFVLMAEKNIALEINTSGFDHRQDPYPAQDILHLARQHNISLIIGSDAHRPEQVGRHFSRFSATHDR